MCACTHTRLPWMTRIIYSLFDQSNIYLQPVVCVSVCVANTEQGGTTRMLFWYYLFIVHITYHHASYSRFTYSCVALFVRFFYLSLLHRPHTRHTTEYGVTWLVCRWVFRCKTDNNNNDGKKRNSKSSWAMGLVLSSVVFNVVLLLSVWLHRTQITNSWTQWISNANHSSRKLPQSSVYFIFHTHTHKRFQ